MGCKPSKPFISEQCRVYTLSYLYMTMQFKIDFSNNESHKVYNARFHAFTDVCRKVFIHQSDHILAGLEATVQTKQFTFTLFRNLNEQIKYLSHEPQDSCCVYANKKYVSSNHD